MALSIMNRARIYQIRLCARLLRALGGIAAGFAVMKLLRVIPLFRITLAAIVGYNRPFSTMKDAAAAITG